MTNAKTHRTMIFISLLISCIASSLLATALTTALPPIMKDIHVNAATGQWLTSGYSLAMGIMMPLTAFLITRFSTRRLYLTGIALFIAGLVINVIAPDFTIMMLGRILQACGNGILTSMAQVVLLTIYPPDQRGTIMGWYGLSIGAAPVIAPTLAGILVDSWGWRMIFYISIAIMVVSFVFALRYFDDVLETKKKRFDMVSFVLSGLAFSGLTLGIGNIASEGITNSKTYLPLFVGCIALVVFVYRQLHLEEAFLDLRTLKHRNFLLSVIGSMLLYFVMMGSTIMMPLYVQTIMGYSATISGLITLPGSLAMMIVSPLAGRIYDRVGMKKLFVVGGLAMLISNGGMWMIDMNTPLIVAGILNTVRCVSIGCLMMPLVTWGISSMDGGYTAHGTALLTSLRTISGAIGSAVVVGIMTLVGTNATAAYGDQAPMHGLNVAFLVITILSTVLLLIPMLFIREKRLDR